MNIVAVRYASAVMVHLTMPCVVHAVKSDDNVWYCASQHFKFTHYLTDLHDL